jgi:Flp pilus assembly protein TadG
MNLQGIFRIRRALRRARREESGQALVLMSLMLVLLLGFAGMVIDFGHVYFSYRALKMSTNAAALAGAEQLPNSTAATTATSYSGVSGNYNAWNNMPGVTMATGYPKIECLSTLTSQGIACVSPANGNAIHVVEQMNVPMFFGALFGFPTAHISASATASARGAVSSPYDVAIILDTTQSMSDADTDCGSGETRLSCALQGVQVLLQNMAPCGASSSTCSISNGVSTNSVDRVALFVFPNVTYSTASYDYDCSSSNPTIPVYSFPTAGASTYNPGTGTSATYQLTPFYSDYKTSDTSSTLNTSSILTKAVNGKSGCTGITNPGGDGTYYAGVIYAAQAALVQQVAADTAAGNTPGQPVIIILSDGEAQASASQMNTKASGYNTKGTYPSSVDECAQAVTAAQYAAAQGTRVYSVAYGSEATGCEVSEGGTDTTTITPCTTMQQIASNPQYFYSDYNQSGSGSTCQSASQPTTNLKQIFTDIAGDFTLARLIPDNTP